MRILRDFGTSSRVRHALLTVVVVSGLSLLLMAQVGVYPQSKAVYYSASAAFTPAATATDIVTVTGSATKLVRVVSLKLTTTNTAAGSQAFVVVKRSTADTTGTFVAGTAIPFDSASGAATAVVGHYTANPGALGTTVGTIATVRVASPAAVPASFAGVAADAGVELLPWAWPNLMDVGIRVRGTAEQLVVNFAGAALVSGQTHAYTVVWSEE